LGRSLLSCYASGRYSTFSNVGPWEKKKKRKLKGKSSERLIGTAHYTLSKRLPTDDGQTLVPSFRRDYVTDRVYCTVLRDYEAKLKTLVPASHASPIALMGTMLRRQRCAHAYKGQKSNKFGMVYGCVVVAFISHPRLCVVVGKRGDAQRLSACNSAH
jgi:hypothetical protein